MKDCMKTKWFERSYRRNLIDMHIDDWNESFLSEFDPLVYVEMLKKAKVQSAMVYANSHVGHCYWPTETGHMHKGLKGRDVLGEIIGLCHKEDIHVVIYYSLLYNNWAYEHNPAWRIIDPDGAATRERNDKPVFSGRYGICCPNSQYKDFAISQIKEICAGYDFEGIFFDMVFWPSVVCRCKACIERCRKETGYDMPKIINWDDPVWTGFQLNRQAWLAEFANSMISTVKSLKPQATAVNTYACATAPWTLGLSEDIVRMSDYACGDFYGGFLQQSFICKMYYSLSKNLPFEFMSSKSFPNLHDHTTVKPREMLEQAAGISIAHNGAFLFIDAIDPKGTLNPRVYETIGEIFEKTKAYEPYTGGRMISDAAVYFSQNSKMDLSENGRSIKQPSGLQPHLEAAVGAARALKEKHIPFGVIGKSNLKDLSGIKLVILPDVLRIDEEEANYLKAFVADGGSLYASGHSFNHLLGDVLGISVEGEIKENVSYIAPNSEGGVLLPGIDPQYPLSVSGRQIRASALCEDEIRAVITLPYTDPADPTSFASIHSNPPGAATGYPAVIWRKYGKGTVLWISAPIEVMKSDTHKRVFETMMRTLLGNRTSFEMKAPASVEAVAFYQPENSRYVVSLINTQEDAAPIPVTGITLKLETGGKQCSGATLLPTGNPLGYRTREGYVEIEIPGLDIFMMICVTYE